MMASDGLSSRNQRPTRAGSNKRGRSQSYYTPAFRYLNKGSTAQEWGPPGTGSEFVDSAAGDTKKHNLRAALLANGGPVSHNSGKRRSSTSNPDPANSRNSSDGDILAYVHKVQPTDTIARVLLLYDIDPGALRKANRLWPNDNIQMRSQLYLPVGDCAVKGVQVSTEGLSTDKPKDSDAMNPPAKKSEATPASPFIGLEPSEGHHSFVQIDPIGLVEIVRLPRPRLSHFPPATNESHTSLLDSTVFEANPAASTEPNIGSMVGEIAKESLEGLEVVGAAIETFVRKVAGNARTSWVSKTTGDLIELTSHLGARSQSADNANRRRSRTPIRDRLPREEASLRTSASSNSLSIHGGGPETSRNRRRIKTPSKTDG